jgi:hypothetical protein
MARQAINRGTTAGDGTGETAFSAFGKVNANFTELYEGFVGKNNVATTNPGVGNDGTQGYAVGSLWFNSTLGGMWVCKSAATGAAVWVGVGLTPIARTLTAGSAGSVNFASIPGTFTDLRLVVSAMSDAAAASVGFKVQFNGDTGANYSYNEIFSNGGNPSGTQVLNVTSSLLGDLSGSTAPTNSGGIIVCDIPSYAGTQFHKHAQCESNQRNSSGAMGYREYTTTIWQNTAAITSILVFPDSGNFQNNSVVSLWGIA